MSDLTGGWNEVMKCAGNRDRPLHLTACGGTSPLLQLHKEGNRLADVIGYHSPDPMKTTIQRLTEILADQFSLDEETILPTSDIYNDLGADSLDQVELVMAIEEEFDIEVPDEDAMKFRTVQQIVEHVDARIA